MPASDPTRVTSKPSRIQVAPSAMTISQCHRLHGMRSSRAGTYDSIHSPGILVKAPSSKLQAPEKFQTGKLQEQRRWFGYWCLVLLWSLELGIWNFIITAMAAKD